MIRPAARFAAFALLVLATQAPARAQTAPRLVGAAVIDTKGKAVGKIEKVIADSSGQPLQVLVRVDRILRTLPVDALTPVGSAYASVLSKAEIAALPPSE